MVVTAADHWEAAAHDRVEPLISGIEDITRTMTPEETAAVRTFLRRTVDAYARVTKV